MLRSLCKLEELISLNGNKTLGKPFLVRKNRCRAEISESLGARLTAIAYILEAH